MADDIVRYRATSAFTDPIILVNAVSLALINQDVRAIIPMGLMPYVAAALAVINIILQLVPFADRPVRLNIAPGDSKTVELKKLD